METIDINNPQTWPTPVLAPVAESGQNTGPTPEQYQQYVNATQGSSTSSNNP
jgi:hypothetical protein